ncbi:hypothetical protein FUAX_26560 [Fulvitalea axinellae]|uniref:Uncharacterized protein n=2 Tax=Fulvitalea axinellae TaxID=1182444 RepID=A0AAU9CUR5_9BACT|nr:hypothetical protein FUAX_26560 [Fulvitalea axinellae]
MTNWRAYNAKTEEQFAERPPNLPEWDTFPKSSVLFKGKDFEVQTDISDLDRLSDLEIVSVPFPETHEGFERLNLALEHICRILAFIPKGFPVRTIKELEAEGLGVATAPRGIIVRKGLSGLVVNPQVTIGLRMDQLAKMMTSMGPGGEKEDLEMMERRDKLRMETGFNILTHFTQRIYNVGKALASARFGMSSYLNSLPEGSRPPLSRELDGLSALVTYYLMRGAEGTNVYPKAFTKLLARTDFGKMFSLLPPMERAHFSKNNGEEWVKLFAHILKPESVLYEAVDWADYRDYTYYAPVRPKQTEFGMDKPFFESGVYKKRTGHYAHLPTDILSSLIREDWLRAMTQGTDLLTARNFPDPAQGHRLQSLGAMGGTVDLVGDDASPSPIIEIRGLYSIYDNDELKRRLKAWFAYLFATNKRMDYEFGEELHPFYTPPPPSESDDSEDNTQDDMS